MKTGRKIKVGLIGCGRISKNHFEAIKTLSDDLSLESVCDINPSTFQRCKDSGLTPKTFQNYEEMLSAGALDLMVVTTPSGLHPDHGIDAAKHGVHVLTEKPMATSLKDADRLIYECSHRGVNLYVVKQNRLNATIQKLKEAIDMGRFGRIYQIITNVIWNRSQAYYDQDAWRGKRDLDGGAFLNQASHYVDLNYYLFGPVKSVYSSTRTMARKIEVEDSGVAIFEFERGYIGSMAVSMLAYPKNYEGALTVIGENGLVKIGGMAVNKIEKWEFKDYHDMDKEIMVSNYEPKNEYGNGHVSFYKKVISHLRGINSSFVDGFEGRKSLEIIMAIYKSAETSQKIFI